MSEASFIVVSAVLLALPVVVKYLLAFEMRHQVAHLKQRERQVRGLAARLKAVERERVVIGRALRQLERQQRLSEVRKTRAGHRLARIPTAPVAESSAPPAATGAFSDSNESQHHFADSVR